MPFNPSYYEKLFEDYGFQNYYNQYYYAMNVDDPLPERFAERHAKFKAKADYNARHINIKNLEKHAEEFATVYNAAWAQHGEAKEITKEQVMKLFKKMKGFSLRQNEKASNESVFSDSEKTRSPLASNKASKFGIGRSPKPHICLRE